MQIFEDALVFCELSMPFFLSVLSHRLFLDLSIEILSFLSIGKWFPSALQLFPPA